MMKMRKWATAQLWGTSGYAIDFPSRNRQLFGQRRAGNTAGTNHYPYFISHCASLLAICAKFTNPRRSAFAKQRHCGLRANLHLFVRGQVGYRIEFAERIGIAHIERIVGANNDTVSANLLDQIT